MAAHPQCQSQNTPPTSPDGENAPLLVRQFQSQFQDAKTLVYLPGIHGDWTLIPGLRIALHNRHHWIEFIYPTLCNPHLDLYAQEIEKELLERTDKPLWLLGESFGSQLVWKLIERGRLPVAGIILAGGFVRYPSSGLLLTGIQICTHVPNAWVRRIFPVYLAYSRFRHRGCPEALEGAHAFVARRTQPDQNRITQRMHLIGAYDPRKIAARTRIPIHSLYGGVDPIVPWGPVRRWLRNHCPSFRGELCVPWADHNVLATAPEICAAQILQWMA